MAFRSGTPVKTCRPSALLGDAVRIMLDEECGCVPVVDAHGRIAGRAAADLQAPRGRTGPDGSGVTTVSAS
jgi:hypothetical protein